MSNDNMIKTVDKFTSNVRLGVKFTSNARQFEALLFANREILPTRNWSQDMTLGNVNRYRKHPATGSTFRSGNAYPSLRTKIAPELQKYPFQQEPRVAINISLAYLHIYDENTFQRCNYQPAAFMDCLRLVLIHFWR